MRSAMCALLLLALAGSGCALGPRSLAPSVHWCGLGKQSGGTPGDPGQPILSWPEPVAQLYHHDPLVRYPTVAGFTLGIMVGLPLFPAFLVLPIPGGFSLEYYGYVMQGLANAGGTAVGTPFLALDYAFVHWWAHAGRKRAP